jgi:hypothetical protein
MFQLKPWMLSPRKSTSKAVYELQLAISQSPVLRMADFFKTFILQMDASGVTLGCFHRSVMVLDSQLPMPPGH